jgi:very-short-patch-repair endonuclease
MSLPEVLLWQALRRQSLGLRFRRQHPVPPYVVYFYCAERRLVIEVDGEAHNRGNRPLHDQARDDFLVRQGYRMIHIPAVDILASPQDVAEAIAASVTMPLHHPAGGPPPHAPHGEDQAGD